MDKYRSPVSGNRTMMFLSWFSGRFASKVAPWRAAPYEIPARTPSVAANSLAAVYASSVVTVQIWSIRL